MSVPKAVGLTTLFDDRLPINRKERYYTGTVLPMIVASDGFKHFGKFLDLCGIPEIALVTDPAFSNIQFFTEYGFEESLRDGAEERFNKPGGRYAPDLVVYIESKQSLLISVEAKVFDRPSKADVRNQLKEQKKLLSIIQSDLVTQPSVYQVALLPQGLWDDMPKRIDDDVQVITWEKIRDTFCRIASPYWIEVLCEALRRYNRLASTTGSGRNAHAKILGREIWEGYANGERTYSWMGRQGGSSGPKLQEDITTDKWKTRRYEVRRCPLPGNNPNWFQVAEFVKKTEGKV